MRRFVVAGVFAFLVSIGVVSSATIPLYTGSINVPAGGTATFAGAPTFSSLPNEPCLSSNGSGTLVGGGSCFGQGSLNYYQVTTPCAGASSDSAAIQAVINTAGTASGGTVVLPPGTCNVHGLAVNYNNVFIQGAGVSSPVDSTLPTTGTALKYDGSAGGTIITWIAGASPCVTCNPYGGGLSNVELKSNAGSAANGVVTKGGWLQTFKNITFVSDGNFSANVIWSTFDSRLTIGGSSYQTFQSINGLNLAAAGNGIWFDGSYNSLVLDSHVTVTNGNGFKFGGGVTANDESDTVSLYRSWGSVTSGGTGAGVLLSCNSNAIYIHDYLGSTSPAVSVLAKGTAFCTGLTGGVTTNDVIYAYQTCCSASLPTIEAGAGLTWFGDNGSINLKTGGTITTTGAVATGALTVTGTATATTFSGSGANLTSIPNSALSNSTISGVALGSNLFSLTPGTHLAGGAYNGSAAISLTTDATSANTASTIVARDSSGNFSMGTLTASQVNATNGNFGDGGTVQANFGLGLNLGTRGSAWNNTLLVWGLAGGGTQVGALYGASAQTVSGVSSTFLEMRTPGVLSMLAIDTSGDVGIAGQLSSIGNIFVAAAVPGGTNVYAANDNAATKGLQLNVPTGSTNGFTFAVNNVAVAKISNAGLGTFVGVAAGGPITTATTGSFSGRVTTVAGFPTFATCADSSAGLITCSATVAYTSATSYACGMSYSTNGDSLTGSASGTTVVNTSNTSVTGTVVGLTLVSGTANLMFNCLGT